MLTGLRVHVVATCPVWEDLATGERRPVRDPAELPAPGRLVAWCNVLDVSIGGRPYTLLAGHGAYAEVR